MILPNTFSTRPIALLGALIFATMGVLALYFVQERTVFLDIAFHLFTILKNNDFAIQNQRFGAFFTQLFPLIGGKIGLSLPVVAGLYSLSFVLLHALSFVLILFVLKNKHIALVYLLFLVVMTTHTFFWIQSELPQGVAYLLLAVALLERQYAHAEMRLPEVLVLCVLLLTVCFTHPLLIFPMAFIGVWLWERYAAHRSTTVAFGLFYLLLYLIKSQLLRAEYDAKAMEGLGNVRTLFPHYLNIPANQQFLKYLWHDYYMLAVALAAVLSYYMYKKSWWKGVWVASCFVGYLLLVNISYAQGAEQFYLENQYLLLTLIVGFPLVYDVLPALPKADYGYGFVGLALVFFGLRVAGAAQQSYTQRLRWYKDFLAKTATLPQKKLMLPDTALPKDTVLMTWGTCYEFWLLSMLQSGEARSIMVTAANNDSELDWALVHRQSFITRWGVFDYPSLKKQYFNFTDTTAYIKYSGQ